MTMSFLALAVIPTLKLTDKGLVDVTSSISCPCLGISGLGRAEDEGEMTGEAQL